MRLFSYLALAACLLSISGCSKNQDRGLRHLAILPANTLIADPASNWIGIAAPLVLEEDLSPAPDLVVATVNDESGAYQWGANDVLRTTVENRNGRFVLRGSITNLSSQKTDEVVNVSSIASTGILSGLNTLAKQVDSHAVSFSTQNDEALKAFAAAAQIPNVQARAETLAKAIALDPSFGLAYLVLVQTAAQAGPQNVLAVIGRGRSHVASFTPVDRVRFQALSLQVARAPLEEQAKAESNVLQLMPHDLSAFIALGSDRFLQNDAKDGQRLFASALQLNPSNLNVQRQLATGLLETRQFAEAERIFANLANNPIVLPELAVCTLLKGDPVRAHSIFETFLASRGQSDPLIPLLNAEWFAASGEIPKAIESLQNVNSSDTGVRTLMLTQIALWQSFAGNFAGAKAAAVHAAQLDPRPASFAALAILLAGSDAPVQEWHQRVSASPLSDPIKSSVLSYGLFLGKHYGEATQAWQQVVQQSGNTDLRARAMLAASLDRAGDHEASRKIVVQPFVPEFGDLYSAISFNEMRRLLGMR